MSAWSTNICADHGTARTLWGSRRFASRPLMSETHLSVMAQEAVDALAPRPNGCYLDATYGRGGHSALILDRLTEHGKLYVLDRDAQAIAHARERFARDPRVHVVFGNFAQLSKLVAPTISFDGALFDLGVSSPQLDQRERGFSFQSDGPLDMRMDRSQSLTAAKWLTEATESQIRDALRTFGEERHAGRIARAIVAERPLSTTRELAELVARVSPPDRHKHPATRTFQAVRMVVNQELESISTALEEVVQKINPGGRLVVISFHSLEDRLVKRFVRARTRPPAGDRRTPPRRVELSWREVGDRRFASKHEQSSNPRSRSAVMRVMERLDA